jgi:hypothetical protein
LVNGTISPTLFSDVLACAVEQGFGEASFFGPGVVPAGVACAVKVKKAKRKVRNAIARASRRRNRK